MRTNDLSFVKRLKIFVAIVEHGSFTGAAEELRTTQPWVSIQLQQLEKRLGLRLIKRGARAAELTHEGHAILPLTKQILADVANLVSVAQDLANADETLLVESELSAIYEPLRNGVLSQFVKENPRIQIIASRRRADTIVERLISRKIDVAYSFCPVVDPRLEAIPMIAHAGVLLMPASHPLAAADVIPRHALSGLKVLTELYTTDTHNPFYRIFQPYNVQWIVPPEPSLDCRLQMTRLFQTPSLWLPYMHDGPLPNDLVARPIECAPFVLTFGVIRLAGRQSRAANLFWKLAKRMSKLAGMGAKLEVAVDFTPAPRHTSADELTSESAAFAA